MLIRNVRDLLRHPLDPSALMDSAPLVVLNNFGGDGKHMKLMSSMLQGMFPAIDIATVRLASCQRVVLFHMDKVCVRIEVA
jgi:ribosome biogenesis protein SSF1/2